MKKRLISAIATAALCLLTACAEALYSDTKTEETFRMIPSAALRDHKIKTIVYDYELSGDTDFSGLRISMKEDGKLNLRYTGKDDRVTEFRLNGDKAVAYEPAKSVFEPADEDVTLAMRFFYDMNFIGPEYMAKYISLVSRVPERLNGDEGPLCYQFKIEMKEDYHVNNIRIFTDAKKHYMVRMLYNRDRGEDENGDKVAVSNSFRDVMIRDGIAVPVLVDSDFLGHKYTMKLKSFRSNMPVPDSLFELTKEDMKNAEKTEALPQQAPLTDGAAPVPEKKSETADKAEK